MSILLRTLTKKSTLNFGKFKDCTVSHLIGMKKKKELISAYFKLSTINFNNEVLDELGITNEWRIEKPSTDKEKYISFLIFAGYEKPFKDKALDKMKAKTKNLTKRQLQSINQGK